MTPLNELETLKRILPEKYSRKLEKILQDIAKYGICGEIEDSNKYTVFDRKIRA